MAGVLDDIAALDFDLACAARLEFYVGDVRKQQAKLIGYEVAKATWGDGSG